MASSTPRILSDDSSAAHSLEKAGFQHVSQEWSYWNRPKYDMHLSLKEGEAGLFKALGEKGRWNVRSATKKVVIRQGLLDEQVEDFYNLLKHTTRKKRIMMRDLDYYRRCRDILGSAGMLQIFVAQVGHRPVAAGISARYGNTGMLFHTSNDYSVPKVGWAMQWEMIRWAISQGCRTYDFAGTATTYPPKETDKGYGVYRFKRSFGAEIIAWYGYTDYVFRPALYQTFRAVERTLPFGERLALGWCQGMISKVHSLLHKAA